jgi:glycosyltransferase involved in cell wall biosynthesis
MKKIFMDEIKVLFIVRPGLFTIRGGDTIQVEETARQLNNLSITVDIKTAEEKMDYGAYRLLHFFNIIRPADILVHIKKSGKPFVVSTILVNYSLYDKVHRRGLAAWLFKRMDFDGIEYLKNLYRYALAKDKLASKSYLWKGQRKCIIEILKQAGCVLVHSAEEYEQLQALYKVSPPFAIVHNGIDEDLFKPGQEKREHNLVLCAARIEGIKNQYNLIKALNNTPYTLLLIGDASPNQHAYYRRCKNLAAGNITFIKHQPQQELLKYYAKAKVHILPSWFEVCGLSSLEAGAMGCNIVITANGYAKEYFKDTAFYCRPDDTDSILTAVHKAAQQADNGVVQSTIIKQYTWKIAAENILAIYKNILS